MAGSKAGYEYLLAYKITVPIYDYTVEFCRLHLPYLPNHPDRTRDQMVQAARSALSNIVEGNKHASRKGYIYLVGISRGSLEELLKDYHAFARHKKLEIFPPAGAKSRIREIGVIWRIIRSTPTLPTHPNFPHFPNSPEHQVNLMITLINQAGYLVDRLEASLKEKHMKEGGLTEELYRKRIQYRSKRL